METVIKDEPKDRNTLLLVPLDEDTLSRQRICHDSQGQELIVPGPAPRRHCKLEPQEVVWTEVTGVRLPIKSEPMVLQEEPKEADPLLLEGLDQVISVKQDRICQAAEEACQDQEVFVPGPAAGNRWRVDPQQEAGTDLTIVRATKPECMAWTSMYNIDELISPDTFDDCADNTYCSDQNSSHPQYGVSDLEKIPLRYYEPSIKVETTAATGSRTTSWDQVQGIDCKVTTAGVEDVAEQGDQPFRGATQHRNRASALGGKKSLHCDLCKKLFKLKSTLRMHIRTHTSNKPYKCQVCNKQFIWPSLLTRHSRIHSGLKPYQCLVCNKRFNQSSTLNTHSRIHSGSKQYQCLVCNMQLSDYSTLTKHSRIHSGFKPYKCQVCNKQFSDSSHLTAHSQMHSGLKPYQCQVCNKQFSRSSYLTTHSRIHSGLRPYQCQVCKKQFRDSSYLTIHSKIHSWFKPYQCHVCNKQFSRSSYLTTHSKIHSGLKPYVCQVCDKRFSQSSHLRTHSRIHSGLKPYECHICDKHFSQSSHLTTHSRIHSGVKPYRCLVCNKQFSDSSTLTKHSRIHK